MEGEHIEKQLPRMGTMWEHRNGNRYKVIAVANTHSTRAEYPVTIVYCGSNGNVWSRPYSEWHRSMTEVGW